MSHGPARQEPWRARPDGLLVAVRLTPKAARDAIEGTGTGPDGPYIAARVRAVPDKGAANAALERLMADWLGVPLRTVALAAGGKSRLKTVAVAGEPKALAARLSARLAAAPDA